MTNVALFDFDGTLVDSMPTWGSKMLHLLEHHHIPYPPDIIKTVTPLGDQGACELFVSMGLPLPVEEARRELDGYALEAYRTSIPAKDFVPEYLEQLSQEGVRICLLTASPSWMFTPCLERLGLMHYFEKAWCCEDLGSVKSDPAIYTQVAKLLGVDKTDITFFEDNLHAVETAAGAGLPVIGVYDELSADDEQALRAVCQQYIHSFAELLKK